MKMPGSPRRRARPAYPIYAVSFRARVFSRFERFVRGVCSACAGSPWVVAFYRVRYGYFMIYRLWVSLPLSLRHTVSHARKTLHDDDKCTCRVITILLKIHMVSALLRRTSGLRR